MKKNTFKNWFTLVELLIVVTIIWFMFTISYQFFSAQNLSEQFSQWLKCSNYAYLEIQQFMTKAKQSQNIEKYDWSSISYIPADIYIIDFNTGNNNDIILKYKTWDTTDTLENLFWNDESSTQSTDTKINCDLDSDYKITLTWSYTLNMTKWLKANKYNQLKGFWISNPSWRITWDVIVKNCYNSYCIDISKYEINIATNSISNYTCIAHEESDEWYEKSKCVRRQ